MPYYLFFLPEEQMRQGLDVDRPVLAAGAAGRGRESRSLPAGIDQRTTDTDTGQDSVWRHITSPPGTVRVPSR